MDTFLITDGNMLTSIIIPLRKIDGKNRHCDTMMAILSDLQIIPIIIPIRVDNIMHTNRVPRKYPIDAGNTAWKNTGAVRIMNAQTIAELIMLLMAIDKKTCHNLIPPMI